MPLLAAPCFQYHLQSVLFHGGGSRRAGIFNATAITITSTTPATSATAITITSTSPAPAVTITSTTALADVTSTATAATGRRGSVIFFAVDVF